MVPVREGLLMNTSIVRMTGSFDKLGCFLLFVISVVVIWVCVCNANTR